MVKENDMSHAESAGHAVIDADPSPPAFRWGSRRRIAVCGVVLLTAALVQWHKPIGRFVYGWYYHREAGGAGIAASDAKASLAPATILIDTREPEEFFVSHLRGAINRPFSKIDEWLNEFDPGEQVVTYCTEGYRSGAAARRLAEGGVEAKSIMGGVLAAVAASPDWLECPQYPPVLHVWSADYAWLAPEGVQAVWNADVAGGENR